MWTTPDVYLGYEIDYRRSRLQEAWGTAPARNGSRSDRLSRLSRLSRGSHRARHGSLRAQSA